MFNKLSFLPTEDIHPVCIAVDDYADENGNINMDHEPVVTDIIDADDVIGNRIRKEKLKSNKPVIDVEDVIGDKIRKAKLQKQKEFNDMLKTALEEHVTIKCHNNGSYIRVRVYFDDEEICVGSCETKV